MAEDKFEQAVIQELVSEEVGLFTSLFRCYC